jgi:hypothetical protein
VNKPTRYRVELVVEDLGEYDAIFLSSIVTATVELRGSNGIHDYEIRSTRHRPGEFS